MKMLLWPVPLASVVVPMASRWPQYGSAPERRRREKQEAVSVEVIRPFTFFSYRFHIHLPLPQVKSQNGFEPAPISPRLCVSVCIRGRLNLHSNVQQE